MNNDLKSNSLLTSFNLFSGQADTTKTTINLNTTVGSTLKSTIDSQNRMRRLVTSKTYRKVNQGLSASVAGNSSLTRPISPDKQTPIIPPQFRLDQTAHNNRYAVRARNHAHNIYQSDANTEEQRSSVKYSRYSSSNQISMKQPVNMSTGKRLRKGKVKRLGQSSG